uniref:Putative secreted protein n=1 Tax=Ixodes ricinus TaxID=34613 RepID=A0A6B0V9F0_IXORI
MIWICALTGAPWVGCADVMAGRTTALAPAGSTPRTASTAGRAWPATGARTTICWGFLGISTGALMGTLVPSPGLPAAGARVVKMRRTARVPPTPGLPGVVTRLVRVVPFTGEPDDTSATLFIPWAAACWGVDTVTVMVLVVVPLGVVPTAPPSCRRFCCMASRCCFSCCSIWARILSALCWACTWASFSRTASCCFSIFSPNCRISQSSRSSSGTQTSVTEGPLCWGDSGLRRSRSPVLWGVTFSLGLEGRSMGTVIRRTRYSERSPKGPMSLRLSSSVVCTSLSVVIVLVPPGGDLACRSSQRRLAQSTRSCRATWWMVVSIWLR